MSIYRWGTEVVGIRSSIVRLMPAVPAAALSRAPCAGRAPFFAAPANTALRTNHVRSDQVAVPTDATLCQPQFSGAPGVVSPAGEERSAAAASFAASVRRFAERFAARPEEVETNDHARRAAGGFADCTAEAVPAQN